MMGQVSEVIKYTLGQEPEGAAVTFELRLRIAISQMEKGGKDKAVSGRGLLTVRHQSAHRVGPQSAPAGPRQRGAGKGPSSREGILFRRQLGAQRFPNRQVFQSYFCLQSGVQIGQWRVTGDNESQRGTNMEAWAGWVWLRNRSQYAAS